MIDENGNQELDHLTGLPRFTGESYEWSLGVGQRAKFPKYVAKILTERYAFLKVEVEAKGQAQQAEGEPAPDLICQYCEYPFGTEKILNKHIQEKHSDIQ